MSTCPLYYLPPRTSREPPESAPRPAEAAGAGALAGAVEGPGLYDGLLELTDIDPLPPMSEYPRPASIVGAGWYTVAGGR